MNNNAAANVPESLFDNIYKVEEWQIKANFSCVIGFVFGRP